MTPHPTQGSRCGADGSAKRRVTVWLDGPAHEALSRRPARERSAFVRDAIAWYAGAAGPLERLAEGIEGLGRRLAAVETRLAAVEAGLAGRAPAAWAGGGGPEDPAFERDVDAAIDRVLNL